MFQQSITTREKRGKSERPLFEGKGPSNERWAQQRPDDDRPYMQRDEPPQPAFPHPAPPKRPATAPRQSTPPKHPAKAPSRPKDHQLQHSSPVHEIIRALQEDCLARREARCLRHRRPPGRSSPAEGKYPLLCQSSVSCLFLLQRVDGSVPLKACHDTTIEWSLKMF